MERTEQYTLHEGAERLPGMLNRRRLYRAGKPLPVWINGDAIDLQASVGGCTVLASSYDYFDGCQHWFYLLGKDGRPIDQIRMPDQFGFIQHVAMQSQQALSFGYLGTGDRWHLTVHEEGFWSFSFKHLVARPNRFLLRKRHLVVHRTIGPSGLPGNAGRPSVRE